MDFSFALDRTLSDFGISAKWLAAASGISEVRISRIRTKTNNPTTKTLTQLLEVLPLEAQIRYFSLVLGLHDSQIKPPELSAQNILEAIESLSEREQAQLIENLFEKIDLLSPSQQAKLLLNLSKKISLNLRQINGQINEEKLPEVLGSKKKQAISWRINMENKSEIPI